MKVNAVTGPSTPTIANSFDNYHTVPDTYTKVAGYNGATDSAEGSQVTTTYAIYTTPYQMTGTYTGQVKYIMVHPSTANGHTITYNANGGTVSPASEVVALGTSTNLPTSTYTNHIFLGWYTDVTGGTKVAEGGDSYSPTENTILHAHWMEGTDLFGITNMQDMTSTICTNTTTPATTATQADTAGGHHGNTSYVPQKTLNDTRGGSYVVRKLADGNCWMVQNLNLTLTAGQSLTNVNTDLNSQTSWNPGTSTSSTIPASSTTSSTSYTRGNKWCYGTALNTNQTCTTTYDSSLMDATNHVGILYNWYAATAGTGTADLVSASATNTTDATDSICPKGWQLPTGGTSNKTNGNSNLYSFYNLLTTNYAVPASQDGSVTMRTAPLSFILSGYYYNGGLNHESTIGDYWSSSAYTSNTQTYTMALYNNSVVPQNYSAKYGGRAIRCVAR